MRKKSGLQQIILIRYVRPADNLTGVLIRKRTDIVHVARTNPVIIGRNRKSQTHITRQARNPTLWHGETQAKRIALHHQGHGISLVYKLALHYGSLLYDARNRRAHN